jgi:hypothetical protein
VTQPSVVITSIAPPTPTLREIARGAIAAGFDFILIGDNKSPSDFELEGCDFYGVERQGQTGLHYAEVCPVGHYARKNIGYLLAMRAGASLILETDDDNIPRSQFWRARHLEARAPFLGFEGWVNVYRYFTDALIWPRGLPLDTIQGNLPKLDSLPVRDVICPIQQGLVDENPDVDAIYRLVLPLPQNFRSDGQIALGAGSWCPFNSQNTAWWPPAYPLLYLPAHCSFRMTDIWRSFVTQKIAWVNGWNILFHAPDAWQDRNDHDLMQDFADETPGYINNRSICAALGELDLRPGIEGLAENLERCYRCLVSHGWLAEQELTLLEAWLEDLRCAGFLAF